MDSIIQLKLEEILEYPNNSKTHPEEQVRKLANSIKKYGFKSIIVVDKDNYIVSGHGRKRALELLQQEGELELETIPCMRADDLTEQEVKELRIADNRLSEMSEWDNEKLTNELLDLDKAFAEELGFKLSVSSNGNDQMQDTEVELNKLDQKTDEYDEMDIRPNEHHDYIVFLFGDKEDYLNAISRLNVEKVYISEHNNKTGLGRVLKGKKLLKLLNK